MLQTTDGGGIYTYGTDGTGSRIAYNETYNIHSGGYHARRHLPRQLRQQLPRRPQPLVQQRHRHQAEPAEHQRAHLQQHLRQNTWDINSSGSLNMSGSVFENNIFSDTLIYGSTAKLINNIYKGTNPSFLNAAAGHFSLASRFAGDRQRCRPGTRHRRLSRRGAGYRRIRVRWHASADRRGRTGNHRTRPAPTQAPDTRASACGRSPDASRRRSSDYEHAAGCDAPWKCRWLPRPDRQHPRCIAIRSRHRQSCPLAQIFGRAVRPHPLEPRRRSLRAQEPEPGLEPAPA